MDTIEEYLTRPSKTIDYFARSSCLTAEEVFHDRLQKTKPIDYFARSSCLTTEEVYLDRLQKIFSDYPHIGVPFQPTKILRGIYIGTTYDAENIRMLKQIGITHVVNCSPEQPIFGVRFRPYHSKKTGVVGYLEVDAKDDDSYVISGHFRAVCRWIYKARTEQGARVLICCNGVSRSGAICMAYMMSIKNMGLLEAAKELKTERWVALCNVSFMRQLIAYAKDLGTLDRLPEKVKVRNYGTARDKYRLYTAHLPTIVVDHCYIDSNFRDRNRTALA